MINIEVFQAETKVALRRAQLAVTATYAARPLAEGLRLKFQQQQREAFRAGGAGRAWPELSQWSTAVRGNSEPILVRSGSFQSQVNAFRGTLIETGAGFDYIYPGVGEADGRYFGITAGQRVNPLAARSRRPGPRGGTKGSNDTPIPMAQVPRPILFGDVRIAIDAREVIQTFMASAGLLFSGGGL